MKNIYYMIQDRNTGEKYHITQDLKSAMKLHAQYSKNGLNVVLLTCNLNGRIIGRAS